MKVQKRFAVAVAGFLPAAVSAKAGVTTGDDHNADFAHYKTYSWGKIQTANGLWDSRVIDAVAVQLAAKDLTEVPSGGDVVVAARDAIHNEKHNANSTRWKTLPITAESRQELCVVNGKAQTRRGIEWTKANDRRVVPFRGAQL
jgi:hypothetical protein